MGKKKKVVKRKKVRKVAAVVVVPPHTEPAVVEVAVVSDRPLTPANVSYQAQDKGLLIRLWNFIAP